MKIRHILKSCMILLLIAVCLSAFAKSPDKTKKTVKAKKPVVYNFVEFLGAQKSIELKIKLAAWFRTWNKFVPDLALKDFSGGVSEGAGLNFSKSQGDGTDAGLNSINARYLRRYNPSGTRFAEFMECAALSRDNGKLVLHFICDDNTWIELNDIKNGTNVKLLDSGLSMWFDEIYWLDDNKMVVCASRMDEIKSEPDGIGINVEFPVIFFYNAANRTLYAFNSAKYTHKRDEYMRACLRKKRVTGYADMVKDGVVLSKEYLDMYR